MILHPCLHHSAVLTTGAVLAALAWPTLPVLIAGDQREHHERISALSDSSSGSPVYERTWPAPVDGVQRRGSSPLLANEDTGALAGGLLDTITIHANSVTVNEIVRCTGEHLADNQQRINDHIWTQLTRVIARPRDDGKGECNRTEYEQMERIRKDAEGGFQRVLLSRTERRFRDGALERVKVNEEIVTKWEEFADVAGALPFSPNQSSDYNYEIASRRLFGNSHLIYEIRYTPKSHFAALPSGMAWIEWPHFAIHRLEGSFRGVLPLPLVLKSVPWFRIRRVRCGDLWVTAEVMARVEMRRVFPGLPASLEVYVRTYDHVIGSRSSAASQVAQ